MTTSAERRRRNTIVAAALAVVGLVIAGAVAWVGAATLADSRAGRDVTSGGGLEQVALPHTPTATLAVIDDDGMLTSVVAMVLAPAGVGGSVVVVPATADSSFARAGDVTPLAETLEVDGPAALLAGIEATTAISFDLAEVVNAERLMELFGRLGDLEIEVPSGLPVDVHDDLFGEDDAAGPVTLTSDRAVQALTARSATGSDALMEPLRAAVWAGWADNVGAGIGSASAPGESEMYQPADVDDFLDHLLAGRVGVRDLRMRAPEPDENPREADAVLLDRPELLLVFGQIAPGRVAAPNDSLTFRIEANFTEEQLQGYGVNNSDVARDVIQIMLFLRANVVSVETAPSGAPTITEAFVADPALIERVQEGWSVLFGEVIVEPAVVQIAGIDATVVLGESYLVMRQDDLAATNDFSPVDSQGDSTG